MSISVCSLGSGSKGNCVLISNEKNNVLIDAGLSASCIYKKLAQHGLSFSDIDAVFITHEHDDHIKGVAELACVVPIYSHPDTLDCIAQKCNVPLKNLMEIEEKEFSIGSLDVLPFRVSHDAIHPYGYRICDYQSKFTYMTDTGYISKGMFSIAAGSDIIMLESNHDTELLKKGKYPEYLKRRILSDLGHLSNEESALTVCDLVKKGATKIMLAHISENNNLPELAYYTTVNFLTTMQIERSAYTLKVASPKETVMLR
ncbi:MBL fold metallo-hydrolase [bacterium]|nr:MBL fold metallo-hydrolase [bacterium]